MGYPDGSMRTRQKTEEINFLKGLAICLVAILISWSIVYGFIRIGMDIYRHFNPTEEIPVYAEEMYEPTTDFSDIEETLKGIERQLEKLNRIEERKADRGL